MSHVFAICEIQNLNVLLWYVLQTLQPVQPKTLSHNALLTSKYKQHISMQPLQKAFAEAPRVTAEALLEKS